MDAKRKGLLKHAALVFAAVVVLCGGLGVANRALGAPLWATAVLGFLIGVSISHFVTRFSEARGWI